MDTVQPIGDNSFSTRSDTASRYIDIVTYSMNDKASFRNIIENENKSHCINITLLSQVSKCNVTVYYFYSSELLWFGAACAILLAVLGAVVNFVSIVALLKSKRLRNATTVFIVNLCVSDMLFCSISMPLTAMTFIHRNWISGDAMCKVFALIKNCNAAVSSLTVIAITMNRYILIVHRNSYPGLYTKKKIILMIVLLWLFPFALLCFPLFRIWGILGFNSEAGFCGVMNLNGKSPRNFIFVGSIIIPAILFVFCYVKIYLVVRKSARNFFTVEVKTAPDSQCIRQSSLYREKNCWGKFKDTYVNFKNKEDRLLRISLAIFIAFVLSTVPITYVKVYKKEFEFPALNILSYVAYFSSNSINPIIYIVMSKEYRRAYKDLFVKIRVVDSAKSCTKS